MVLKDTIANSIISLEEAISNIQPGGQEWSEHAATQDVDLDGHKITGLGEPTDASDAATKAYVDSQSGGGGGGTPDRIKGGAGTIYGETEIGVGPDATGASNILLSGKNRGDEFLRLNALDNDSGTGWIGWRNNKPGYGRGYVSWSWSGASLHGEFSNGNFGNVYVDGDYGGNVYFTTPDGGVMLLGSPPYSTPSVRALPSHVNSILHGIKLGVDAHDALANYDWSEYPAVQDVDLNTFKITNLADPTNPQDAATKAYVDANSGGGGPTDRIESPSGGAFVESTDDFMGTGVPASIMRVESNGSSAQVFAYAAPGVDKTYALVSVGPEDNIEGVVGFGAVHDTASDEYSLRAGGAPLEIEEPVESNHAATKGYVDSQLGGGGGSLLTSDDANTFITASNDSLLIGYDQYSKKLVVEEFDPNEPGTIISKSIEEWDDIARDEAIWGSVDGAGKAFMRTNYAFVEDSNDKSWGFQWDNAIFEGYSHHGINITQGDTRLTFATVDTSSGDFYLASETFAEDYWSRVDIRKDNIEIRASKDYNETSFKIEPNGSFTNKPLDMGNNRITNVENPTNPQDAATKAYVDANSGGGKHWGVFEGSLTNLPGRDGNPLSPEDRARLSVGDIAMLVHPSSPSQTSIFYCSANPPAPAYTQWRRVLTQASEGPARFDLGGGTRLTGLPVSVDSSDAVRRQELVFWPESVSAGGHHLNSLADPLYAHQAATKGYVDARLPELEWWEPTWTPVANVSSVSNIECQYTRTYRAAGGSLVTLEGTIEVTPSGTGMILVTAATPVAATSAQVAGVLTYIEGEAPPTKLGVVSVTSGTLNVIADSDDGSELTIIFRISYRAA